MIEVRRGGSVLGRHHQLLRPRDALSSRDLDIAVAVAGPGGLLGRRAVAAVAAAVDAAAAAAVALLAGRNLVFGL